MVQFILISGTLIALSFGVTLLVLVLIRTIRNSAAATASSEIPPLETNEVSAAEHDWRLGEPVIRGYDTPELYREDYAARSGGQATDRQLR